MLTSRVIPCLDVRDNRVVKGVKFSGLRDVGTPALLAAKYERQGADELVVLDISATNANRNMRLETVQQVREALSIPLTVGGGVRTIEDVQRLTDAGTDKVSMNSAAVQSPELIGSVANLFGSQCTVVAVDVRWASGHWEVLTHAGTKATGQNVIEWVREVESRGAGEVLLTSFDRDGTRSGYDCDLLRSVSDAVSIPVIASGGASNALHMREAFDAGASAVLIASILHDGVTTVARLKKELETMGVCVRGVC